MITVEQAIETILSQVKVLGTERVNILSALERVLAEDVFAPYDVPPLDNSAMDGYALRHKDIRGATKKNPSRLKIIGDLPAGYTATDYIVEGAALRIMTGAPIPKGADTVIMQEDTRAQGNAVEILKESPLGSNIRRAGEDIKRGECVLASRTPLRAAQIGVLASVKRAFVTVYQRPRVAILSTGDELVDIDESLSGGKIVSSNSYSLYSLVRESGALPVSLGIAKDTKEELKQKFTEGLHADMILSSGGVSVGDYDFVKEVLKDIGLDMKFWKVAMRPGQPLAFGTIEGKPTFGLPGNPVSVMVSFEQFVRPAIRKMSGHKQLFRQIVKAKTQEKLTKRKGKKYFVRCLLFSHEGSLLAKTTGEQGSGILMSMAKANGLIVLSEEQETINAGETVNVQVLDREFGHSERPCY